MNKLDLTDFIGSYIQRPCHPKPFSASNNVWSLLDENNNDIKTNYEHPGPNENASSTTVVNTKHYLSYQSQTHHGHPTTSHHRLPSNITSFQNGKHHRCHTRELQPVLQGPIIFQSVDPGSIHKVYHRWTEPYGHTTINAKELIRRGGIKIVART